MNLWEGGEEHRNLGVRHPYSSILDNEFYLRNSVIVVELLGTHLYLTALRIFYRDGEYLNKDFLESLLVGPNFFGQGAVVTIVQPDLLVLGELLEEVDRVLQDLHHAEVAGLQGQGIGLQKWKI